MSWLTWRDAWSMASLWNSNWWRQRDSSKFLRRVLHAPWVSMADDDCDPIGVIGRGFPSSISATSALTFFMRRWAIRPNRTNSVSPVSSPAMMASLYLEVGMPIVPHVGLVHLYMSPWGLAVFKHFLHELYDHDLSIFITFTVTSHSVFCKTHKESK